MAREWLLNAALNRWQFNRPRYVGRLSEAIRQCGPRNLDAWRAYYLSDIKPESPMLGGNMDEHLDEVGTRMYAKISEQLADEITSVTVEECQTYVREVMIDRTFQGYETERITIYEQLQDLAGIAFQSAPDERDRLYNVDFYYQVGMHCLGIQVNPITYKTSPQLDGWRARMKESHERFRRDHGGNVFIVFSAQVEKKKSIQNPEVIGDIQAEVERLKRAQG